MTMTMSPPISVSGSGDGRHPHRTRRSQIAAALGTAGALVLGVLPLQAPAQTPGVTELGQRLGPSYAQMVNLSSSPDFATARYHVRSEPGIRMDVTRLPVAGKTYDWDARTLIETRLVAGYLRLASEIPVHGTSTGRLDTRWVAYGLTAGLGARIALDERFTLVPGFDAGVAQLENRTEYLAGAAFVQPLLDGTVFNWRSHAWLTTPSAGLEWADETEERRVEIRTRLAWSRVASFGESDPALRFRQSGGTFSVRGERTSPTNWAWFGHSPAWVLLAGHTAFLGPGRGVLGFPWISELGAGLEWPSRASSDAPARLRVTLSGLFGPDVRGLTAGVGIDY